MGRISNEEKAAGKGRREKKQASLQSWMERLKKGRGAKRRSPSPPAPALAPAPARDPAPLSFFKVMIGSFRDVLFIPPMAACTLKSLVKKYVHIEDSDANTWSIKLSIVDGSLAFQNGWHDFVIDHSITVGEFVIFTYNGGLLFTVRIFGTNSLERVNSQLRKSSRKRMKRRSSAELGSNNVRIPKRYNSFQPSKDRHSSHNSENMQDLKKKIEVKSCDFPEVNINESDSFFENVPEDPSAGWKSPHHNTNTKESNEGLKLDYVQAWRRTSDHKIGEKLDVISDTDLIMLDGKNHEAVVKGITNSTTSEQAAVGLLGDGTPLTPQVAGKPHSMDKFASSWQMNAHIEIKEIPYGVNASQMREREVDCRMETNGNIEENHSNSLELPIGEQLEDMMVAKYNLKCEKHSTKMEVNLAESEGLCCTIDEKSSKLVSIDGMNITGQNDSICHYQVAHHLETHQIISSDPSIDILGFTVVENKDIAPTSEEYVKHQSKVKREAFIDEEDVTPCSGLRIPIGKEIIELVEVPSSSRSSFTVCIPHDVQQSLELPENLASQIGKLKHERRVFVLQDPTLKCWPVLYLESLDYVGFISGWIDFAVANNICKGDICKFELIDDKKLLFRVQIKKG